MVMRSQWKVYIQLGLAMMIVGSNVVAGKMITGMLPVFLASTLRFGIASLVLSLIVWRSEGRLPRISRRDLSVTFLLALVGNFLYSICLLYGLKLTSATESGIIAGTTPVVTAALSFLILRERLSTRKALGIVLVGVGMVVMNMAGVSGQHSEVGTNTLLGNLLIFGTVIGEALWALLSKLVSPNTRPFTVAWLTCCWGLLLFSVPGIGQAVQVSLPHVALSAWLVVLYYALVGTAGAYCLWYHAVPKVSASTAGIFTGLMPVSAVLLSYVLLREELSWSHLLGITCVLLALLLITLKGPTERNVLREAISPLSSSL